MTGRKLALAVTASGVLLFVLLALFLVPWDPVPGGPLTAPPADTVFTADEIRRAEDFSSWARAWSWSALAVSLLTACVLGFTRLGPALVGRLPRPWVVRVVLAVAALQLIGRLLTLPFAILLRRLTRQYGLSEQAWSAYAVDLVKAQAVNLVVVSVTVVALVGIARRWPRAWPAVSAAVLGVLVLLGSFVYPLLVEPLFNQFTPLPDGPLRVRILELADREGVEVDDVLVADASRRTTTLNAYVSGIGASRRVVVFDTLVEDLSEDEALSVVAHELAHARHQDVVTGSLLGAAGAVVGTGLLGLLLPAVGQQRDVRDPRTVPRLLALVAVGGLLAAPVQNGISRLIETRADVDALRATEDPTSFVEMQVELARRSLADPTPPAWSAFWFGSHPTTLKRIAVAERFTD
jgi:STE24 endopeptidase